MLKTGAYTVPKEVSDLKPREIPCVIKAITTESKTSGTRKHYYVYERSKTGSGKIIGKIKDGKFCPNARGRQLLNEHDSTRKKTATEQKSETALLSDKELEMVKKTAHSLHVDADKLILPLKNYGEYAVVLSCTTDVLRRLRKFMSEYDARMIYTLSVIFFVQEYLPGGYVEDAYHASILSNKWPDLNINADEVRKYLKVLGNHQGSLSVLSQDLINESSGLTAINYHAVLTCPKQNDLDDYRNKFQRIEDGSIRIVQLYDAINEVPLTGEPYDGDLLFQDTVKDLLDIYDYPKRTVFLIDDQSYSERDMGLYRKGGTHFVASVPDREIISQAMRSSISFNNSFINWKINKYGEEPENIIQYRESTVKELENLYQTILDKKTQNQKPTAGCKDDETSQNPSQAAINRSHYGNDRVIMFRDEGIHRTLELDYSYDIKYDEGHTEEELSRIGPEFGLMILRTNLPKETSPAPDLYADYKKRWTMQTHYRFVENAIQFCNLDTSLNTSGYYVSQGLCFLLIPMGQIKAAMLKHIASSSSYVKDMSIKECLIRASHFKFVQGLDKQWHISISNDKDANLLHEMGVNVAEDIRVLNATQP